MFTEAGDGDMRSDPAARQRVSQQCDISPDWATVRQLHGSIVHRVSRSGPAGEGDGLWTSVTGVPIGVFTADCVGVVLHAQHAVGVAHAGWRGVVAGVVTELRQAMIGCGFPPIRAAVGPGIGSCCFEVGKEVADMFEESTSATSWGTTSVDLKLAIENQLAGLETWVAEGCTRHEPGWFSHRRDGTNSRLATVGWI